MDAADYGLMFWFCVLVSAIVALVAAVIITVVVEVRSRREDARTRRELDELLESDG